jgi:hypothetical protein
LFQCTMQFGSWGSVFYGCMASFDMWCRLICNDVQNLPNYKVSHTLSGNIKISGALVQLHLTI